MNEISSKENVTNKMSEKDIFTKVVNHASKNERVAWNRKRKKLTAIIEDRIEPIEGTILELTMQKQGIMDEVVALRDVLITECVHPRDCLVQKDDHILCHFCERKLQVNV